VQGKVGRNGARTLGWFKICDTICSQRRYIEKPSPDFKGKGPSFLQIYHHTGIVIIMWGAVVSQATWLYFPVVLNSFIHTLMYSYFFVKTILPATEIKAAKYLTLAQIGQFFAGLIFGSCVLIVDEQCDSDASRFWLACISVYGCGLIALFEAFTKRRYGRQNKKID
jgi:hypothetical protein